ncbi:kinase-like domain-containing protein [Chytriomyces sp. MP71]|nr:kinase-like domain-containing protein [Chytriomyces sp. MP71]
MKQELERVLMEQAEGYNTEINGLFCVIRVITAGWNAAHRLAHDIDVDLGSLGLDYNTLIALVRRLNDELLALQKDYNRLWKVGREMNDVLSYAWQKYCTLSAKVDYLSREAASLRERVEMLDEALVALRVDPEVPSCPQKGMDFLRLNSKPYDWRRDYKPVRIPGTRLPSNIRFLTSNVDSSLYAVKKIPLVDVDGVNNSGNIAECVWIHQALGRHDNILPLVDVYLFGTDFVSLVMPKLKETLQGLRQRRGIFKESVALYTIRQVLTGLKALHDLGVLHRDIKLDNIGVCPRGNIKIFDFDFSRRDVVGANCTKQCGTPGYMPFEILHRHKYGFPVDVFSAGIAFHQLISPPLDYEIVTARMILSSGEFLDFEEGLSVDVQRTIETMVAEDPKERPTPTQLLAVSQTLNFRSMAYLLCCYQS